MRSRNRAAWFLALSAVVAVCSLTFAGVEPSPWHVVISDRTDRLVPGSTFYNQTLSGMALTVQVAVGDALPTPVLIPIVDGDRIVSVAPGGTISFAVDPAKLTELSAGAQILSWSFSASVAGAPGTSALTVFAFDSKDASPTGQPPFLTASYLTGEMPILGFASPGVVLGAVQLVTDELFYTACPSLPEIGFAWKNHGHYVRCIAQRAEALVNAARITQDDADAFVSAAAQSETGKK